MPVHDIPSWLVAALSALVGCAATWASFKALVKYRIDQLEKSRDDLEDEVETLKTYLHVIDKQFSIGLAVQATADEITAKMRHALPPHDKRRR